MRGNDKVLKDLGESLKAELTAINQYFLHAKMCENWGYFRLGAFYRKESIEEMVHAEKLKQLNDAIRVATDVGDNASRALFEQILGDEEEHVDYLEGQLHAIGQMGMENYLAQQLHKGEEEKD